MSYLTNCPPCDTNFPILCEPLETTANGKRLVVEDAAACQKTIQTPTGQQILKTDNYGNLSWTNGANDTVLTKSATGVIEFTTVSSQIPDGSITTDKLASAAVTTSKLETNSVTTLKIADSAVTEPKIATDAVTESKLSASAVTNTKIANLSVTAEKLGTDEQKQICKAWVNFNGTGTIGSNQTIRSGYNVSSVLKNGTGDYTVNFTTPMNDVNYAFLASCGNVSGGAINPSVTPFIQALTTSTARLILNGATGTPADMNQVVAQVFGN
jgi:hypothetical protein